MNDHDLRSIADTLDLTQGEIAQLAGGVNIRTVRRWMSGETKVPRLVAERMAAELAKGPAKGRVEG
jgi:DNA-binding transcriptional regulator YiaG